VEFPAGSALQDPNPLLASAVRLALLDLLEEAERVRASLAALAAAAEDQAAEAGEVRALIVEAASALDVIAEAATLCFVSSERDPTRNRAARRLLGAGRAKRCSCNCVTVGRVLCNLEGVLSPVHPGSGPA